jgi:hypothetical protein
MVAVLVGRPRDKDWDRIIQEAMAEMEEVRKLGMEQDAFDEKCLNNRRGNFVTLSTGVSFGGGATVGLGLSQISQDFNKFS